MEEQGPSVVIAEEQEEIDSIVAMLSSMKRNLDGTETLVRQGRVKRRPPRAMASQTLQLPGLLPRVQLLPLLIRRQDSPDSTTEGGSLSNITGSKGSALMARGMYTSEVSSASASSSDNDGKSDQQT